MSRLAEYIAIIGVKDFPELYHGRELKGTVIQRFPEKDRKDDQFPQALELFSQPSGWMATVVHKPPSFYIAVLTDVEGNHSYCACLSFHEPVTVRRRRQSEIPIQGDSSDLPSISVEEDDAGSMTYYVPKCLCLISKQNQFETLKNCLTTIYVTFLKNEVVLLQRMIGCALGFVNIPPPGGLPLTFSLGGGDNQVIHPPLSDTVPVTRDSLAIVFNQLGIHNMLEVFTALVTENKILLLSTSYTHLTMTAQALIALMYPLNFSYVYIPVLPLTLLDFLSAPTPFLMGVHVSYERQLPDMFDVVRVHIDEGYVTVPDNINLPIIPEPFYSRMMSSLKLILTPSLLSADLLFQPPPIQSNLALQDKELRAVFVQFFAEIFCGYRSCLTLIRIHPKPVISFNKISFLEKRGLIGDEFLNKVLDSVSFSTFTQKRGPSFRECDMFDELVASVPSNLSLEDTPVDSIMEKIHEIARQLYENEPGLQHSPDESSVAAIRDGNIEAYKPFPLLDAIEVENYIDQNAGNGTNEAYKAVKKDSLRVPVGRQTYHTHYINQRRLEVIKECVDYIFENKISDSRKILPSVLRALKSKGAQLFLCNELGSKVKQNRSLLEHDQFNLVIRLMNAALQDDSSLNTTSVAAALLPLACAFCRKLGPGVIQFAYTCIQDHPIWSSLQFWEEAFYADAQNQIVDLHLKDRIQTKTTFSDILDLDKLELKKTHSDGEAMRKLSPDQGKKALRSSMLISPVTATPVRSRSNSQVYSSNEKLLLSEANEKTLLPAMDLAAELLSEWNTRSKEEQNRLVVSEESIVYSLAVLFANRMISMRVPLDACIEMRRYNEKRRRAMERATRNQLQAGDDTASNMDDTVSFRTDTVAGRQQSMFVESVSNFPGSVRDGSSSVAGSMAWGSMHDLTDGVECGDSIADTISKFILRFVERVCLEADITAEHLKSLQNLVPGLVSMHIDTLEEVYRETKSLAPTQKAKIMKPTLLQGELLQFDGLRCYLVPDGRDLGVRTIAETPVASDRTEDGDREINIGSDIGGPCLLPAEGAVFLTNYRVIFKGTPVDQFTSEMIVTRAFPVGALVREKRVSGAYQVLPNCILHESLQLRSSTFQMLKLCFDQEVTGDRIENFRRHLQKLRWPQTVYSFFAFLNKETRIPLQRTLSQRQQSVRRSHKSLTTVAALAKKKVSTSTRNSLRKHKYSVSDDNDQRKRLDSVNHVNDKSASPRPSTDEESLDGFVAVENEGNVSLRTINRGPDRLSETPLCKDYERVGLGGVFRLVQGSTWRISMVNYHYTVCRSYPAVVVVPSKVSDDCILKVAKNHRLNRFPVAVWRHRKTKGVLLRAGGISKGVMTAILRTGFGGAGSQGLLSSNVSEDEKYFTEIVNTTALIRQKGKAQSISIGAALSLSAINDDLSTVVGGENDIGKAVDDDLHARNWDPANLYVFSDKALPKGTKTEVTSKCTYVPVEVHDASQVKTSFTKLLKTCCPSSTKSNSGFHTQLEDSKWLQQISLILQVACSIVNLIEIQGSSCLVCFGDGTDVTTQVISLAQLMLDPYYRTIEGFRVLVEKEWLAFGYRFSHRGNHVANVQSGSIPFFLQFLDGVYQIMEQYPQAFEFNRFFLSFLAYHHVSMRFSTFMLDSEHERVQHGWLIENDSFQKSAPKNVTKNSQRPASATVPGEVKGQPQRSAGQSVWEYVQKHSTRQTLFHNFKYHANLCKGVLQPFCNVSNLSLWDFYTTENLYTGASFEIELTAELDAVNPGTHLTDTEPSLDLKEDLNQCLSGCYGNVNHFACDEVSYLLSEIFRLREELDQTPQPWQEMWEGVDVRPHLRQMQRKVDWQTIWSKERRLALHKRATMEMVLQGKADELMGHVKKEPGFEHPHNFQLHNYLAQAICDYCLRSIWGFGSGYQCTECGYNVHDKCQSLAPTQCPKHGTIQEQQASNMSTSTHSVPGSDHSSRPTQNPRSYRGKLFKRGQMLRQWKARWFVLDAQKNQMLYYDSEEDTQLQGSIDLGDMQSCIITGAPPGAPKWADAKSFFELRTARRYYFLLAPDRDTALEWVDRLNSLIA